MRDPDPVRRLVDERIPWASHGPVFSRQLLGTGPMPAQGWKLHVSASPPSAAAVLEAALDVLLEEGARFKVVNSIELLTLLNAGNLGLTQIGKFVTVYPTDDGEAVKLARALDRATDGHPGPRVPTDRPLRPDSLVHYRYGAMHQGADDGSEDVGGYDLLDAAGRLTSDVRVHYYVPPADSVEDPFESAGLYVPRPPRSHLLDARYLVVGGLSHGLRGGVFRALDLGSMPVQFCLLKEAWHDVSIDRHGRDAREWLVNEERILRRHADCAVLPRVYGSFELDGNRYLAIEYLEGRPLTEVLSEPHAPSGMDLEAVVAIGRETARALAELHERGIVVRDFSPGNILQTPDGGYRLIDFGTAFDLAQASGIPIGGGTPPFYSWEQYEHRMPTPADDVFAWGAVLHRLCCGAASVADASDDDYGLRPFPRKPVRDLRPDVPTALAEVVDRAVAWELGERYETMWETERALLQALGRIGPRPVAHRVDAPEATPRPGRETLFQLARDVGDALCAAAEEREEGGLAWPARNEVSDAVEYTPDLYSGAAGIGLFLAELWRLTAEPRYADAARGAARWLAGPVWARGLAQHGLHCGEPGIAFFFVRLAELLEEPGFVTAAELRFRRLEGAPAATVDVAHGSAGTILGLLSLHRAAGHAWHLASARRAGDQLVTAALPAPDGGPGCYWDVPPVLPGVAGEPYLGLLHGSAGIALALVELAAAASDEHYLEVARGAAELLLAHAVPVRTDAGTDGLSWPRRLGDADVGLQAHCHGAGGITRLFLALDSLEPDARYRDAARGSARAMSAQRRREAHSSVCHGLAGLGHVMLDCARAFGEPEWHEFALDCATRLQPFRDPQHRGVYRTRARGVVSPDLMLGYAGVGSLFMRLVDPESSEEIILGRVVASKETRREQALAGRSV